VQGPGGRVSSLISRVVFFPNPDESHRQLLGRIIAKASGLLQRLQGFGCVSPAGRKRGRICVSKGGKCGLPLHNTQRGDWLGPLEWTEC
jgi:hypothetical protein